MKNAPQHVSRQQDRNAYVPSPQMAVHRPESLFLYRVVITINGNLLGEELQQFKYIYIYIYVHTHIYMCVYIYICLYIIVCEPVQHPCAIFFMLLI